MTLLSFSNINCALSYCALRTMGSLEAVVLIWTVNREQYLVAPLKLELKLSVRAGFKHRRLPKAANYWERAAMALLLFCFQVFNPEIAAVPALNVDNPLLSEKSGNMSSRHCHKGYPLSFLSIIPFPLISCPMPIRGKVNLILQDGVLHLLPLRFFGTLLPAGTFHSYRSNSVPGLPFGGGKERRLDMGLPSGVIWDICVLSCSGG